MTKTNRLRLILASCYSASLTIWLIAWLTVGSELSEEIKASLADLTGHHWVSKSWLSVIVYLLGLWILQSRFKQITDQQAVKAVYSLIGSLLGASLVVTGSYLLHYWGVV